MFSKIKKVLFRNKKLLILTVQLLISLPNLFAQNNAPAIIEPTPEIKLEAAGPKTAEQKPLQNITEKSEDPIQIMTSVDKQTIYIGDAILFTIGIEWEKGINITKVEPNPALGVFEIQDIHPSKETKLSKTRTKREYSYTLSTFDTGDFDIPPFIINYVNSKNEQKTAFSQPIKINVKSVAGTSDAKIEVKDIKSPAKLPRPQIYKIIAWSLLALLLVGIPLAFYIRRRILARKGLLPEMIKAIPPAEEAMLEIDKLEAEAEELFAKGQFKIFYSRATEILKIFIGRVYQINAIDMTSYELMKSLPEFITSNEVLDKIEELLNEADLVKFAKYIPKLENAKNIIPNIKLLIDKISPAPQEREELKGEMASSPIPQGATPIPSLSESPEKSENSYGIQNNSNSTASDNANNNEQNSNTEKSEDVK